MGIGSRTDASDALIPPAVSTNQLTVIPEMPVEPAVASSARIVAYRAQDMSPLPETPAPPAAVGAIGAPPNVVVTWKDVSNNEDGFVIEERNGAGYYSVIGYAETNHEQVLVHLIFGGPVRVRAWNAGGSSQPSAEVISRVPPRRRSAATK